MKKQYKGITQRMLSEIESISGQMSHQGEKGKNNELVLSKFLKTYLPERYTVSTGKVQAVGGLESGQVDIIIHDRFNVPALMDAHAWSFVPIEAVTAVISVKTTLNKAELQDAVESIQSVRNLPRKAATSDGQPPIVLFPENVVLRPRAYVFSFKSNWKDAEVVDKVFKEVVTDVDDDLRPNGVCILNQATVIRRPYTVDTILFPEDALLHFFNHLVIAMNTRPVYSVDLSQYFTDDYGVTGPSTKPKQ